MKKLFLSLVAIAAMAANGLCQSYQKDGNVIKVVEQNDTTSVKQTGYYLEIKGVKYPIYKGKKGGFYIYRTSKDGKVYKQYLKKEEVELLIK